MLLYVTVKRSIEFAGQRIDSLCSTINIKETDFQLQIQYNYVKILANNKEIKRANPKRMPRMQIIQECKSTKQPKTKKPLI